MTARYALATLVLAVLLLALSGTGAALQIIDRVLAVVGGRIITLSDARAAVELDLVPIGESSAPLADALDQLVDRRLMLAEIERYAPPEPTAAAIDEALATVRRRFDSEQAFDEALTRAGVSREELRRALRDTLRIEAYQRQRFGAMLQPAEEDLVRYYREHTDAFTVAGTPRPFEAVRDEVQARVVEARRVALVEEWLDGLRRRGHVVVLYRPEA
jgi:hypothetical protein